MINKRHVSIGVAAVVAMALFGIYVLQGITGRISSDFPVKVTFSHVGQLLRVTGDVKLRGVLVGKISRIEHRPDGTGTVTLAIDPGQRIPADISASIRGKTLFGEKFVELIDPPEPGAEALKPGAVIPESRTTPAFELEQVIQTLIPLLDETRPGDLGGALHALAQGLAGNEEAARRAIDNTLIVLDTLGAGRGDLDRLLAGIDEGSDALRRASPDLIAALAEIDLVARTLAENRGLAEAVLRDTPRWLEIAARLAEDRYRDLVDLSVKGADVLDLVAAHAGDLPFAVDALKDFTQDWDTNLSTPCDNAEGLTIDQLHPELAGSTCWQVWALTAEKDRNPGGYDDNDRPVPGATAAAAAYRAQVAHLLALPFGSAPSALTLLLYRPLADAEGLIPEEML